MAADTQRIIRAGGVVHRIGVGKVLVRRVAEIEPRSAELVGAAGIVWIASDQPSTSESLADELELPLEQVNAAIDILLDSGWIEEVAETPTSSVEP